jgi:SAM-dependent methyltransferase
MNVLSKAYRAVKRVNLAIEPTLRHAWVYLRAVYFIRIRRRLRTLQSGDTVKASVLHNMKSIYGANNRMNLLLYPVAIIEILNADSKILVIGPRNENDLYSLVGLGFKLKNIRGLDLLSYSPYVELGDMHAIPFPDDTFDAVICGWTLSYSTNPAKAAKEMTRVAKPGGVIAIGLEYSQLSPQDERALIGYEIQELDKIGIRINSTAQVRELFGDNVDTVFFEHDAPRKVSHSAERLVADVSNIALVFQLPARKRMAAVSQ